MKKKWIVYVHRNKTNGKQYVGITSKPKPEDRWREGRGYKENPHFYAAVVKYGWDGFEHIILETDLDVETAKEKEKELIKRRSTQDRLYGYNMTSGGDGTPDYHPSAETRAKLSKARMKENLSSETLQRRSDGLRGRKFSKEHKKKIGDSNSKAINMYSKDGTLLRTFRAACDAETELGISHSHISQCCHGRRKSSGGYLWQFVQ